MKFGKVNDAGNIDLKLPVDHHATKEFLRTNGNDTDDQEVFVGCAKWNRTELKNFYPPGTRDELAYYSSQFNCIEFNASFYRIFPPEQFAKWKDKTPDDFRFFPKVYQEISHWKRLQDAKLVVDEYIHSVSFLEEKLGMVFLQLNENFAPKDFDRVVNFVNNWPLYVPLAVEFRHTGWYNDDEIADRLYDLFESNNITNIITDTAGRRDLLHMRLTTSCAFVRYVGANHPSDYGRLDEWIDRLEQWKKSGLRQICFFIHQNMELESPLLAAYFIKKLNTRIGTKLIVPRTIGEQRTLF